METVRNLLGRVNIGSAVLGGALLIAPKELRKQAMWNTNVTKLVRRYDDAVLAFAVGLIGAVTRQDLLQRAMIYALAFSINDVYAEMVAKEPFIVVQSGSIEGFNFDANASVELYIDGSKVTATITSDANGHFTYTPSTALASGTHTVVALTPNKATYVVAGV